MKSIASYIRDVRFELTKVTWPKKSEVVTLASTVIIISALVGVYVGGLDYVFVRLLEFLLSR